MVVRAYSPISQKFLVDPLEAMRIGEGIWGPSQIPNLNLWLRADLGITLNGSTVSAWADQSGTGNNFSQSTAILQPSMNATGLNGQPTLVFGGIQNLTVASYTPPVTDAECWIVNRSTASLASLSQFGSANSTFYPFQDGNIYDSFAASVRKSCGAPVTPISAYHVFSAKSAANAWTCYLTGTTQFTTATNTVSFSVGGYLATTISGSNLTGDIAEVGISRIMTTGVRAQLKDYLSNRYGFVFGSDW